MTAVAFVLFGAACMIVGACGLALVQSTTRDRYHAATPEEKARVRRALREVNAQDIRRGK